MFDDDLFLKIVAGFVCFVMIPFVMFLIVIVVLQVFGVHTGLSDAQ